MNLHLAAQALRMLADALEAPVQAELLNTVTVTATATPTPTPEPEVKTRTRRTKAEIEAEKAAAAAAAETKAPNAVTAPAAGDDWGTDTASTTQTGSATTAAETSDANLWDDPAPAATTPVVPTVAEMNAALSEKCKTVNRQKVAALLGGKRLTDMTDDERVKLAADLAALTA